MYQPTKHHVLTAAALIAACFFIFQSCGRKKEITNLTSACHEQAAIITRDSTEVVNDRYTMQQDSITILHYKVSICALKTATDTYFSTTQQIFTALQSPN